MRRRSRRIYVFGVGGLESNRAQQEQMTLKLERGLFSGVERSDRTVGSDKKVKVNIKV